MCVMHLDDIQAALRDAGIDGWLFYDHHHRDPIGERILGLDPKAHVTRRWYYYVPAEGEPRKLVHRIEQSRLDTLPGTKGEYSSWQELAVGLDAMLGDARRIAMQYSPSNAIMYVSMVDAGTVEFLRSLGKIIVSSADMVSRFEAVMSAEQIASHTRRAAGDRQDSGRGLEGDCAPPAPGEGREGQRRLHRVRSHAVARQRDAPRKSHVGERAQRERERQQLRLALRADRGEVPADQGRRFHAGRSLGARRSSRKACTTTLPGRAWWAASPPSANRRVFTTVRNARDAAIAVIEQAFAEGRPIMGFEADDAARGVIRAAGFGAVLYASHRAQHRARTARLGRAPRQSRNPRRARILPQHVLLGRAGDLSAGVWRAQRSEHDHGGEEGVGDGKDADGAGENLKKRPSGHLHLDKRASFG